MNKYIKTLILIALLIPNISFGAFSVGWQGTSTTQDWIFPNLVNGRLQTIVGKNFIASSTSEASRLPFASTTQITSSETATFGTSLKATLKSTTSTTNTGGTDFQRVQGRYLYMIVNNSASTNYLEIWDVFNPERPTYVGGSSAIGHGVSFMDIAGDYLYVSATSDRNVEIWDVSNVSAPYKASTISIGGSENVQRVAIRGPYLYIGATSLYTYNVSNPASPVLISALNSGGSIGNLYIQGRYLYGIDPGNQRLKIYDVGNPAKPFEVSNTSISSLGVFPFPITVSGKYLYLGGGIIGGKLGIYDISNPVTPVQLGTLTYNLQAFTEYEIVGNYLFAIIDATPGSLAIFNIASSTNPVLVTSLALGNRPDNITVSGKYIYATSYTDSTFNIIEVSGVTTPTLDAGAISTEQLDVKGNAIINNHLTVNTALNVGIGGILSRGAIGVSATTSRSIFPYASSTAFTTVYASSTNLFGNGLQTCDPTTGKLVWASGLFGCGTDGGGGSLSGGGFAGMMASWSNSSTLQATSTILGSHFIATSTTATSTFAGDITQGTGKILTTHAVRADASDGVYLQANNYTNSALFGVGNTANSLLYGSTIISGNTTGYGLLTVPNLIATSTNATSTFQGTVYMDKSKLSFATTSRPQIDFGYFIQGDNAFYIGGSYNDNLPAFFIDETGDYLGMETDGFNAEISVSGPTQLARSRIAYGYNQMIVDDNGIFYTANGVVDYGNDLVTYSGKTGYGTSTPWGFLSVERNPLIAPNNSTPTLVIASSSITQMVLGGNGNFGLGTTSPGTLLSLGNTNGTNISVTGTSTFATGIVIKNGCLEINNACVGGAGGGSGTVTSVDMTVPTFLSVSGNPITTSGTLAVSLSGTALPVANGGTGQTGFGQGWLHSDGTTLTSSTSPTVNYITATSTSRASFFPLASTTQFTASSTSFLERSIWSSSITDKANLRGLSNTMTVNTGNTTTGAETFVGHFNTVQLNTNISTSVLGVTGILNSVVNNARAPVTTASGINTSLTINSSTGHLTTNAIGLYASTPVLFSSTTNIYGVKVDSPLRISGTHTNVYGIRIEDQTITATNIWNLYSAGAANNYLGGNTGIGSTTPYAKLSVTQTGTSGNPSFLVEDSASPDTTPFVITQTGDVGIGTTSPWRTFSVNGTVGMSGLTGATGGTNQDICINANGELINETTGTCIVSSRKYKNNIQPLNMSGLEKILKLKPVIYSYNEDDVSDYKDRQYGFIAEEVAEVDPHFAKYGIDGEPRTLDDRALLGTAIKAIQELKAENDKLKKRISKLENI